VICPHFRQVVAESAINGNAALFRWPACKSLIGELPIRHTTGLLEVDVTVMEPLNMSLEVHSVLAGQKSS